MWKRIAPMVAAVAPGLFLSAAVAVLADRLAALEASASRALFDESLFVAPPVMALILGIALHGLGARPEFGSGIAFATKRVLRWAIALSGLNVALSDVTGLGLSVVVMVVASMAATLASAFAFARILKLGDEFGALAGAACAVCGASAALATASVLPRGANHEAKTAFVVIVTNLLATFAMLAYPPFCALVGFDHRTTGIFLGASIHDVAQVVGAGYSVSKETGNLALIVKLFRVFLLLPVVLAIGWRFARCRPDAARAKAPVPIFALMFLAFVAANSLVVIPEFLKEALLAGSRWGLLLALSALGLDTSLRAILRVGRGPFLLVAMTTAVVFIVPATLLFLSR